VSREAPPLKQELKQPGPAASGGRSRIASLHQSLRRASLRNCGFCGPSGGTRDQAIESTNIMWLRVASGQGQVALMEGANEGFPSIYLCTARWGAPWQDGASTTSCSGGGPRRTRLPRPRPLNSVFCDSRA
jgi:hypothetical protein